MHKLRRVPENWPRNVNGCCYSTDTVTTNFDPPKMVPPGPYISKYLDPPEHVFQQNVEIYGPPLKYLSPPPTKSQRFKQVYRIVFTKGGLATTDLRLAEFLSPPCKRALEVDSMIEVIWNWNITTKRYSF